MSTFDNREKAFEDKFAHDEELRFKITARRNKLLGLWAAGKMHLPEEKAKQYLQQIIQLGLDHPGDDGVITKILGDLREAGVDLSENEMRNILETFYITAKEEIMTEE